MDEFALVATAIRRFARARLLDMRYNDLIYRRPRLAPALRGLPLARIVHVHYRSAFHKPGSLGTVRPPFDAESPVFRWLDARLPLEPATEDAEEIGLRSLI